MKKLIRSFKQGLADFLTPHDEGGATLQEVFDRIKLSPLHDGAPDGVFRTEAWVYEAILEYGKGEATTLETGAGASTLFFAKASKSSHIVVTRDVNDIKNIKKYAQTYAEIIRQVEFVNQSSIDFLPFLKQELGMVLIDGCHGPFIPFMDFYYSVKNLRDGGYVIIDDTHLIAPKVLFEFVSKEPEVVVVHKSARAALLKIKSKKFLDYDWWESGVPYQLEKDLFTEELFREGTHVSELH